MSSPVITVGEDVNLSDVATIMLQKDIGCLPVVDAEGRLIGLVTTSDFIAREKGVPFSTIRAPQLFGRWLKEGAETLYELAGTTPVKEIMTRRPVALSEDDLVKTFLERIVSHRISHAPIMRGDELVGIVSKHDLLKLIAKPKGDAAPAADTAPPVK